MDKKHILDEIRRTANGNGGSPLGRQRFFAETGIKASDWSGKYWVRWNDALVEAGFSPNQLNLAYDEEFLLEKFAFLIKELGHFPVSNEIKMKARHDDQFPSHNTFSRLGRKHELAAKLVKFCHERNGYDDVVAICTPLIAQTADTTNNIEEVADIIIKLV